MSGIARAIASSKPSAYWDRTTKAVRDWKTDQPLPEYQGTCLVYRDIEGPVFLRTFLEDGERCWEWEAESPAPDACTRASASNFSCSARLRG